MNQHDLTAARPDVPDRATRPPRRLGRGATRAQHPPVPRQKWPAVVMAAFAGVVFAVGLSWFHNGAESLVGLHQVVAVGVQRQAHGLQMLDLYIVPTAAASGTPAPASWELAGALVITHGSEDRLVGAKIDGRQATVTAGAGTPGAVTVTTERPTPVGLAAGDARVTVADPALRAGTVVPVTLTFAHRGDVHVSVPVLVSAAGPSDAATAGGAG
ncbi:hypothetical protein FE374_03340 [Georgenia yuyongxinii]|uniref:Copper chaperone PCu(A)C n=1 Tax=Georgenia yuyongxinii TaxID=2589797 RepID=A0A5B8C3R5_9MICO|nr:hypothetical protein [Georgenia yuyongxinii]QDC23792.1 hypothetical protein FE374_03340 [Georgenia yuyongxinii]